MTPDWIALKAELATNPYQGQSDQAAADLLNAPGSIAPQPIPAVWVATYFGLTGLRGTIEDVSRDANNPLRSACLGLIDFFWGVGAGRVFDVTDPNLLGMLGGFVEAGLMSAGQRDALVNLNATAGPSRALITFGVPVSSLDVAHARSLS